MAVSALRRHNLPEHLLPVRKDGLPNKGGYPNHPCTIWAGDSSENFIWLCELGQSLIAEYNYRYSKQHANQLTFAQLVEYDNYIPEGDLTEFVLAMPDEYKTCDPVISYREYYKHEKKFAKWRYGAPHWWK